MIDWESHWYKNKTSALSFSLLPFSWAFSLAVKTRQFLYKTKLKKSYSFPVPVIVVGNITVGGTGKTPTVIWLANFFKKNNLKVGIVSRGVGGVAKHTPHRVTASSDVRIVGDEAIVLARRTDVPVVVCIDRVAAIHELLAKDHCQVIISDDGLQHYRMQRDVEIVLIDSDREFGNQYLLPAGPLRESPKRLREVDFVIKHGETLQLHGDTLVSLKNENEKIPLTHFKNQTVHAVAAVGNPKRFFDNLRAQGLQIIEHIFPDHFGFQKKHLAFNDDLPIIMTEKDATKCFAFADERWWYLPVAANLDEAFGQQLFAKLFK